jgi:hypothetical protein
MKVNKKIIEDLKRNYKLSVNAYIYAFEDKQNTEFDGWVGKNFGEVAYFNGVIISFDDLRHDIDNNAKKGAYIDFFEREDFIINYRNWLLITNNIEK